MSEQLAEIEQRSLASAMPGEVALRRKLLEVLLAAPEPRKMTRHLVTYEEFLAWADEDTLAEWVDGYESDGLECGLWDAPG